MPLRARLLRLLGFSRTDPAASGKPCTFDGCHGVMTMEDRPWASYVTWVCNSNPEHAAVVYKEGTPCKPCRAAGCSGMMRFNSRRQEGLGQWEWPWYATWVCERDAAHFEVIPEADHREMVRAGVIPPQW
jgi:hypothetical protein